jgi:uncharacterized membrane protein
VKVTLDYIPPAGRLGKYIAKLFGEEPGQQIRDDLHRLQQLMESGDAATTQGQPYIGASANVSTPGGGA